MAVSILMKFCLCSLAASFIFVSSWLVCMPLVSATHHKTQQEGNEESANAFLASAPPPPPRSPHLRPSPPPASLPPPTEPASFTQMSLWDRASSALGTTTTLNSFFEREGSGAGCSNDAWIQAARREWINGEYSREVRNPELTGFAEGVGLRIDGGLDLSHIIVPCDTDTSSHDHGAFFGYSTKGKFIATLNRAYDQARIGTGVRLELQPTMERNGKPTYVDVVVPLLLTKSSRVQWDPFQYVASEFKTSLVDLNVLEHYDIAGRGTTAQEERWTTAFSEKDLRRPRARFIWALREANSGAKFTQKIAITLQQETEKPEKLSCFFFNIRNRELYERWFANMAGDVGEQDGNPKIIPAIQVKRDGIEGLEPEPSVRRTERQLSTSSK